MTVIKSNVRNTNTNLRDVSGSTLSHFKRYMRLLWLRSAGRKAAMNNAKFYQEETKECYNKMLNRHVLTSRKKNYYQCDLCKDYKDKSEIQVDHLIPLPLFDCASNTRIEKIPVSDIANYLAHLFVLPNGLRVLCKSCHKSRTALQTKERAKLKKVEL